MKFEILYSYSTNKCNDTGVFQVTLLIRGKARVCGPMSTCCWHPHLLHYFTLPPWNLAFRGMSHSYTPCDPSQTSNPEGPFYVIPWHLVILLKGRGWRHFHPHHSSVLVWPSRAKSSILEGWVCTLSFSYPWDLNPGTLSRIWFKIEKGEECNMCICLNSDHLSPFKICLKEARAPAWPIQDLHGKTIHAIGFAWTHFFFFFWTV